MNRFALAATASAALAAAAYYYYVSSKKKLVDKTKSNSTKGKQDEASDVALSGYESLIGNTPMVELRVASELTGCRILVKVLNGNEYN